MDYLVINQVGNKSPHILFMAQGFESKRAKMLKELNVSSEIEEQALNKLRYLNLTSIDTLKQGILYLFTKAEIEPYERLLGLWCYWMVEIFHCNPNAVEDLKEKIQIIESVI